VIVLFPINGLEYLQNPNGDFVFDLQGLIFFWKPAGCKWSAHGMAPE